MIGYIFDQEEWDSLVDELVAGGWLNLEGDYLSTNYRGRGTYGAECVAFTGDIQEFARFIAGVTLIADEAVESVVDVVQMDNMGTAFVFYFPGVRVR